MKDELAQALLGKVMQWDASSPLQSLEALQSLARFKYDEYQRFQPGRKFVESLAIWLEIDSILVKNDRRHMNSSVADSFSLAMQD